MPKQSQPNIASLLLAITGKAEASANISLLALSFKKFPENLTAFLRQHAALDFRPMVHLLKWKPHHRPDGPGLRIGCAKNKPPDPGLDDGAKAHGARFKRDIQVTAGQPIIFLFGGGPPDGHDFRVRGGVVLADRLIITAC
jgi:hypothetical protein